MSDMDHGPMTCTYYECKAASTTLCPFLSSKVQRPNTQPTYLPGQVAILDFSYSRRAVLIVAAEMLDDGSWVYRDWDGNKFVDKDVETIITRS